MSIKNNEDVVILAYMVGIIAAFGGLIALAGWLAL